MALVSVVPGQQILAAQVQQFKDLLTGVMNDQPVTLKGDYSVVGPSLRVGSLTAATKGGWIGFQDAGAVKWEFGKEADNSLKLWDTSRAGFVMAFAPSGDITFPSAAKLVGSADFRTAARLIAGADPGGGIAGDVIANRGGTSPGTGVVYFGSSGGSHYIYYDGGVFNVTDPLSVAGKVITDTGILLSGSGDPVGPGIHRFDPYIYVEGNGQILLRPTHGSATGQTFIDGTGKHILTHTLDVPPSAGGTVAPTNYGTVPIKIAEFDTTLSAATVTFSSIPTGFRNLLYTARLRDGSGATNLSNLTIVFNGATTGYYDSQGAFSTTATATQSINQVFLRAGVTANGGLTSTWAAVSSGRIFDYNSGYLKPVIWEGTGWVALTSGSFNRYSGGGMWNSTAAITSILFQSNSVSTTLVGIISIYGEP